MSSKQRWEPVATPDGTALAKLIHTPSAVAPLEIASSRSAFGPATCSLPRRPWIAAEQYGMRFLISDENEIVMRADRLPLGMLRAMAEAANQWAENKAKGQSASHESS